MQIAPFIKDCLMRTCTRKNLKAKVALIHMAMLLLEGGLEEGAADKKMRWAYAS